MWMPGWAALGWEPVIYFTLIWSNPTDNGVTVSDGTFDVESFPRETMLTDAEKEWRGRKKRGMFDSLHLSISFIGKETRKNKKPFKFSEKVWKKKKIQCLNRENVQKKKKNHCKHWIQSMHALIQPYQRHLNIKYCQATHFFFPLEHTKRLTLNKK